jgi:prepilin-type N-terminal cleavage/methylation domain-containing protein
MKRKNNQGFTLVELLLVVGILGILSMAVLLTLNPFTQIQKGNDAKRKADLSQIQKALEVYYQDYGAYPDQLSYKLDPITTPGPPPIKTQKNWGSSWQPYMNVLPSDPVPTKHYVYYTSNGQFYYLYASLDRGTKDPQACSGSQGQCSGAGLSNMTTLCGGVCNFGVSSPDKTP